jgi:hypothetical protein
MGDMEKCMVYILYTSGGGRQGWDMT